MKRPARTSTARGIVALALTWDGARWPVKSLSPKCRAFLAGPISLPTGKLAALFARDDIDEIRICWVARLKGGDEVLAAPFPAPENKRLSFRAARVVRLGENLGVVYRRASG
jgi:hypothetical protein